MKKTKIIGNILLVLLSCFTFVIPAKVTGQSMILIGRDTFEMYSNPLDADPDFCTEIWERIPENDYYIRDIPTCTGWWRLQNDSLFLEKIVDCQNSMRSEDHKTVLVDIEGIFDAYKQGGKIFASWYSGELDVVGGKRIHDRGFGFGYDYENEWIYHVEKGVVISKTTYRNERKEAALWYNLVSALVENLFNGDRFPELENKHLLAEVEVIPRPDGSIDSLDIRACVVSDKTFLFDMDDDDDRWIKNDFSNPYIKELKECVLLVPAWDYLKVRDRVYPISIWSSDIWKGKGCRAVYPDYGMYRDRTDSLAVDGKEYILKNYPLQYDMNLYARLRPLLRDDFMPGCIRGYVAHWEIRDSKLYLNSISRAKSGQPVSLDVIFPGNDGSPVEASWYTGELHLQGGDSLGREYPLMDIYRDEIFYKIEKGKIVGQTTYNNSFRERDEVSYARCQEEIARYDWGGKFPELENKVLTCEFWVWPKENGERDSMRLILHVNEPRLADRREITDPTHPYMAIYRKALESVTRWEVLTFRGKIQPVEDWIADRRYFPDLKAKERVTGN